MAITSDSHVYCHRVGSCYLISEPTGGGQSDVVEEFVALVRKYLEPELIQRGFASAQAGWSDNSVQIIFCSSADNFAQRFGASDFAGRQPNEGGCRDIVVEGSLTDRWHLKGIRLEGDFFALPDNSQSSSEEEEVRLASRTFLPMLRGEVPVVWTNGRE